MKILRKSQKGCKIKSIYFWEMLNFFAFFQSFAYATYEKPVIRVNGIPIRAKVCHSNCFRQNNKLLSQLNIEPFLVPKKHTEIFATNRTDSPFYTMEYKRFVFRIFAMFTQKIKNFSTDYKNSLDCEPNNISCVFLVV